MKKKCEHCRGEGYLEQDNNGPFVECPVCQGTGFREVTQKKSPDPKKGA